MLRIGAAAAVIGCDERSASNEGMGPEECTPRPHSHSKNPMPYASNAARRAKEHVAATMKHHDSWSGCRSTVRFPVLPPTVDT